MKFFHGRSSWWQAIFQHPQEQSYVSDLFFDPSFGTHVLNVAVPILDDQRTELVGAISILLRRDSLFQSVSEVTVGETGHAMLVASDGTPLLCPVLSLEEHAVKPHLVHAMATQKAGWVMANPDSHGAENSIVGFAPLRLGLGHETASFGGHQWRVLVRQDPRETYAPLNQLLIKVATYGVVVFVILWITGVVVAGRIVRPIQTLYEGAQRIGSGNLEHHLDLKTGDEIEILAEAFNKMARNLKQSFAQLNQKMSEIGRLEERYRDLIENSPEMIHQLDESGKFVHVNQTELDKLGYSLQFMLEMSLWDIVPDDRKPEIVAYLKGLGNQESKTIETVFLTCEGDPIDVEIHSTILVDPKTGALVYSRGFVGDISERKILQREVERYTIGLEQQVSERTQQLSVSESRYKALFNLAADSILIVDEHGCIEAVNDRELDALGHGMSDLIGGSVLDLVLPVYREITLRLLQNVKQGEGKIPNGRNCCL